MAYEKNILGTVVLTLFFALLLLVISIIPAIGTESVYAFSNGSPGARTNSPGDGQNCNGCHSGIINSGPGVVSITALDLSSGYVPGQTYTITGTVTQNAINKFGFEMTAEKDLDNTKSGTIVITDASRTKLVNASNAITHQSNGTSGSGSNTWSFDWIAPIAGTGNVTFYGAFNSANGFGNTAGDNIYTTSFSVIEDVSVDISEQFSNFTLQIFPNPASKYFKVSNNIKIDVVKIYNLIGKKVLEYEHNNNKFDIADLPVGYYIVNVVSNGKSFNEKLIKN